MKKLILFFAIIALTIVACQDNSDEITPNQEVTAIDMSDFFVYTNDDTLSAKATADAKNDKCYSMKVLNRQLKENPSLEKRMYDIELHTRKLIAAKGKPGSGGGGTPTPDPTPYAGAVSIPVVVNILEDPAHPVTQAHIDSQIAILNADFNNNNPNTAGVPSEFASLVADVNITFTLAAVNRKASSKSSWGTNDAMKLSSQGGIDATDPANNLNLWVCEIGGGILGYAQFPGGTLATDGVVIGSDFLGENTAGGVYGHGRTATHEVGHWLNLRHIWGDGRCRQDDFVDDTPSSDAPNYGDPIYPTVNCKSNDMTMNYMDYVYDNAMYMFSKGQNDRMRTIFAVGGSRESFVQ
ncbi:pregnancy-associated plasma protein-A [Lutibacter oceani]|uniref:Pregnancy-associated plasma protein-A n=1 Tax=Lutibacter oceani TaxID=1853311 RepID=A0A3D9S4N6_9FLAO|nr:zinc metalloprotease [Lutibacter oceani]REE83815.1 pregnancy-associated plasma protein-A [Lutibacter oceani]